MNKNIDSNNSFYKVKKGVVFYFYSSPNIFIIKELVENFNTIVNANYTNYALLTGTLKKIKGNWFDFFYETLEEANFNNTFTFLLTDANKEKIHNSLIQFSLCNMNSNFLIKLPNSIYFEFNDESSWSEIYSFIKCACYSMTYHLISAGYNVGINNLLYPKSVAEGMKELKNNKIAYSLKSTWDNVNLLKLLSNKIGGPNIIQVLNKAMFTAIGYNNIDKACECNKIDFELGEDYIILSVPKTNILDGNEIIESKILLNLKNQFELLRPIITKYQRPSMFWKDDDWDNWMGRFE